MRKILHVITRSNDPLAGEVIALQQKAKERTVKVIDLTEPNPDYERLLREIFKADSIEVW